MQRFRFHSLVLKYFCLLSILLFFKNQNLSAQTHSWSKMPSVEVYYSPLSIERYGFGSSITSDEKYSFNTTNVALTFPISEKLRVGSHFMTIANKVIDEPIDRSWASGIFGQYNFLATQRLSIYAEGGYTISNLCPCGTAETYTGDSLNHFLQIGLAANYALTKRLHIKAGFINYSPIGGRFDIYNWTQPFIGLNFHFYEKYQTPFKSRFKEKTVATSKPTNEEELPRLMNDEKIRTWNFGFSSLGNGYNVKQPNGNNLRYGEYSFTPRVNYWVNQAILLGVQGTYYRYRNNHDNIERADGFGAGFQARFYPLSFKDPSKHRFIRVGSRANFSLAPMFGTEVRIGNYSWFQPEISGNAWDFIDAQPYAGFVFSYKRWFNLYIAASRTIGLSEAGGTMPRRGGSVIGFEYNLTRER